jgi:trimeric autotransporter adhesin
MASTYSSLKIQLMGTGENSGTWGIVTNTNLGTALEEAIVGSADVTFSNADITLTLADTNTSQTARNLRLNLTGTVSATKELIVPSIEKVYIVNNALTFAITVRTAAGTGIAVPAGKTMWVYNNGVNVVDAVNHLTSLTLAIPLPNSSTTASSSNGASTIVARDASGNFTANTITSNVSGNVTGNVTGTATNAVNLTTANFSIVQSGSDLLIKNGATTIITISSTGAITATGDITSTS